MSSVSSLADASSTDDIVCTQGATVHDDLSFMKVCADVQARTHENGKKSSILPQGANIASLKHQLFLKATEARRWQDSVLHLSSVVTGKEEELNRERERNAEMAEELERVQGTAHEYRVEMDRVRNEHHHATKQIAALQSEIQGVLGTCSSIERNVLRLENLLQQERDDHAHTKSELEDVNREVLSSHWRQDHSNRMMLEMQDKLQTALADRRDALRYAQSLYASCEALANESKHEVDRYCYLNLEVQRLTRVFEEQRQLHAQQHDQIRSQQLVIETLEARLKHGGLAFDKNKDERMEQLRCGSELLREQLTTCLADYSNVCVRQNHLVSFLDQTRIFLTKVIDEFKFISHEFAHVRCEYELSVAIESADEQDIAQLDTVELRMQMQQRKKELNFALDKQVELSLQVKAYQEKIAGHEAALLEAEKALEQAERAGANSSHVIAELNKRLDERSIQLAIAEENSRQNRNSSEDLLEQMEPVADRSNTVQDVERTLEIELQCVMKSIEIMSAQVAELEKTFVAAQDKALLTGSALSAARRRADEAGNEVDEALNKAKEAQSTVKELQMRCGRGDCDSAKKLQEHIKGQTKREENLLQAAEERYRALEVNMQETQDKAGHQLQEAEVRAREALMQGKAAEDRCKTLALDLQNMEKETSRKLREEEEKTKRAEERAKNAEKRAQDAQDECKIQTEKLQKQIKGQVQREESRVKAADDRWKALSLEMQQAAEEAARKLREAEERAERAESSLQKAQTKCVDGDQGLNAQASVERKQSTPPARLLPSTPGPSPGRFAASPPDRPLPLKPSSPASSQAGEGATPRTKTGAANEMLPASPSTPASDAGDANTFEGNCDDRCQVLQQEANTLRQELEDVRSQLEECEIKLVEARGEAKEIRLRLAALQIDCADHMSKESMKKACDGKCEVAELLREQVEDLQVRLVQAVEDKVVASRALSGGTSAGKCPDCAEQSDEDELRKKLEDAEEALYILEEENQANIETANELRQQLHKALRAEGSKEGDTKLPEQNTKREMESEDSIEEDIQELQECDGLCLTAQSLRETVKKLKEELADRCEGQDKLRQDEEACVNRDASAQGEISNGTAKCHGDCQVALDLRQQLGVAAARSDDAELENDVLQRKLGLCKSELAALRTRFHVPDDFFSSDN